MTDIDHMRRALQLAALCRGAVEPNPMVGAVVVRDGQRIGEGWHPKFGEPHAEVFALRQAGELARGATLYVTLEPCCHHGKTPPCTDAVLAAGIARIVVSMRDPFPRVAGGGIAKLQEAGVSVEVGLGEDEARRLATAPYLKLLAKGRPWVHAKWAMTLDGKIATRTGDSKWISGSSSRRLVHELRGRVDAIVVGIGTALADDPHLTARPPGPRLALRVVMDRQARLPLSCNLVESAPGVPTLVAHSADAPPERVRELSESGCSVLVCSSVGELLDHLGQRRFTNILVEGGGEVLGAFLDAGEIDEVHAFIAPRLVGGGQALSPVAGTGVAAIADALTLTDCTTQVIDGDVYVNGRVAPR